jgi:tetratricopeptide (TPR) repeat protein
MLIAAVSAAYSNSLQGELIFDDVATIRDNPSIQQLWPLTTVLWPADQQGRTSDGRPLVALSLAVNYATSGLNVWSYHVFNLVVHIGATLALFGLARQTLLLPKLSPRFGQQATALACAIALVWGLHPLQTQAVTYIVQRAESMMGLLYLLTLYFVVRGETSPRPRRWHVAAFVACLAGMVTKEVMVTAPLVVLLYLWVFVFGSLRETLVQRWRLLVALASTWLLLAALVLPQGGRGGSVDLGAPLSPARYSAMQLVAIVHYLKLCFSPSPLVLDYWKEFEVSSARLAACGAILTALLAGTLWALKRQPWIGFLGSAFFLILAPSSSVVPIITQVMAEHRMYLPLAAVVALVVMLAYLAWQKLVGVLPAEAARRRLVRGFPVAVTALVALVLGLQTWLRNLDYRTAFSIWTDTLAKQPLNPRPHSALATLYIESQRPEQAIYHLSQVIRLTEKHHLHHYVRGLLYLQRKELEKALADMDECLTLDPTFADAYVRRGMVYMEMKQPQQAIADFTRALELKPELTASYRYRATAYAKLDRIAEAQADAREFLRRGGPSDEGLQEILDAR